MSQQGNLKIRCQIGIHIALDHSNFIGTNAFVVVAQLSPANTYLEYVLGERLISIDQVLASIAEKSIRHVSPAKKSVIKSQLGLNPTRWCCI
jgi:hypothetical protein